MNKTKIIATIGPSTQSAQQLVNFIKAGMNVARINLSHGDRASHKKLINLVKEARRIAKTDTAILLDTRGPEIRIQEMDQPIILTQGQELTLTTDLSTSKSDCVRVDYPDLIGDIQIGDKILLDDGKLSLEVLAISSPDIRTKVIVGGQLGSHKRVSLPNLSINLPSLTPEDIKDIAFGVEQGVDFIAATFVRTAEDVWDVRKIIESIKGHQAIIAKIENRQGVENIDDIIKVADGLMIAPGDLVAEMAAEEIPVVQKQLIKKANLAGKPAITATKMLESMITNPTPTRAEASDVTNAVFDGSDALMLSAETAIGENPLDSIRFLVRCAEIAEASLDYEEILASGLRHRQPVIHDAISYASCSTAAELEASAIITASISGSTARMVAKYRPKAPIIAVSPSLESVRRMQLIRGVIPLPCPMTTSMDELLDRAIHVATQSKLVRNGDLAVITAGMPIQTTGMTNMLKVHIVADVCHTGQGIGTAMTDGTVRIIEQESDWENLPENVIVVLFSTDHTMLEKLTKVSGIITEQAGLTSHAAIIGRELDIPVICNVPHATSLFENGQTITIDGATGQICYGSMRNK